MNKEKFTKLEDEALEFVSGGIAKSAIDGYSSYIARIEKNRIFKWGLYNGRNELIDEYIFKNSAVNGKMKYDREMWETQNDRYAKLNEIVRQKMRSED